MGKFFLSSSLPTRLPTRGNNVAIPQLLRTTLSPACCANRCFDEVASESGPSEAPAPENSKTQRRDEIIVLARWRRIERRAARPYAALHRREFRLQDLPVPNAGNAQRIVAQARRRSSRQVRSCSTSIVGPPPSGRRSRWASASAGRRETWRLLWRRRSAILPPARAGRPRGLQQRRCCWSSRTPPSPDYRDQQWLRRQLRLRTASQARTV
jgi:hypothetical protein